MATLISISDGIAIVDVVPPTGGSLASFRWEHNGHVVDWLRPADPAALALSNPNGMSCFPLIPYSNRIRDGRFDFAGRIVELPRTVPDDPHFEHGHGWRHPWIVSEHNGSAVVLHYRHEADSWPWAYLAEQRISLANGTLSIRVALQNLSKTPMPAGLGLHPYFPSIRPARIEASASGKWETDDDVLPTRLVTLHPEENPTGGVDVSKVDFDNVFTGWSRSARVSWPKDARALDIVADDPLNFLVLYTPPGERFFCVEPVSNITNAFNLVNGGVANTGFMVIEPGKTRFAGVRFIPSERKHDGR